MNQSLQAILDVLSANRIDKDKYKNADGTTTKAVEHRAGWDATFSAPKSVSLTALVGLGGVG